MKFISLEIIVSDCLCYLISKNIKVKSKITIKWYKLLRSRKYNIIVKIRTLVRPVGQSTSQGEVLCTG